jgi:hypothetical protein
MDILIHENGKTYDSKDKDFDYSLWYVFIKYAFEKFSTEQISDIEARGGYIELTLDENSHYSKPRYILKNVPEGMRLPLQAILDE